MPGLDPQIIDQLNPKLAVGRIKTDIHTDFILAPHYSAVYEHAADDLWEVTRRQLRSGAYEPELPITIDVPKRNGLTRPGSILSPSDRLIYQAIVDLIAPAAESEIDRTRVFSNVLFKRDPEFQMFEPNHIWWPKFQKAINKNCSDHRFSYVIKGDIANYFERIYQHLLINLLHGSGCDSKAVTFLERLLSAFMEKDSHGIIQGIFPSDFLGNFGMCGVDADLEDRGISFVRFVDDLYLFFPSLDSARKGLVDLCRTLRNEGLHLNESKSEIVKTADLLHQETELDRMFNEARQEAEDSLEMTEMYGFQTFWKSEDEEATEEDIELQAVEKLYEQVITVGDTQAEKIERFCLPMLSATGSETAIERSLKGISERPYLSQMYCSYLTRFAGSNADIVRGLESLIRKGEVIFDWQLMWPVAALIGAKNVSPRTVSAAFGLLRTPIRSIALRALCALLIAKHGTAGQRHNLRNHYSEEASPYVRGSILFSSRYFPAPERNTCLSTWRGHSPMNTLIAQAVKALQ